MAATPGWFNMYRMENIRLEEGCISSPKSWRCSYFGTQYVKSTRCHWLCLICWKKENNLVNSLQEGTQPCLLSITGPLGLLLTINQSFCPICRALKGSWLILGNVFPCVYITDMDMGGHWSGKTTCMVCVRVCACCRLIRLFTLTLVNVYTWRRFYMCFF